MLLPELLREQEQQVPEEHTEWADHRGLQADSRRAGSHRADMAECRKGSGLPNPSQDRRLKRSSRFRNQGCR